MNYDIVFLIIITNKAGESMNKNNILLIITILFFGVLLMLSGCKELISDYNFVEYNIGEHFVENRDGYFIKLNDSFFANITYKNKEIEIYKLLDTTSTDYFSNSELYYSDNISECYCDNSNIIVYSLTNNKYVIIDCNDINNIQSFSEIYSQNIDLTKFTIVI